MKSFIPYLSTLISLLVIDGIWLASTGKAFYGKYLAHLIAPSMSWIPVILFYFIYALGITVFVVSPAIRNNMSLGHVFLLGAFLGLIAYGAYDFTNQATLRDWPIIVTIVDLLWGAFLTGVVSALTVWISRM